MKKIIFLLLTLLAACGASAADFKAGGIYYNINEDGKSVSVTSSDDRNELYSGNINIPESVKFNSKKYAVTAIGSYAFDNCTALTSVTLPSSVTEIRKDAFYNCASLTSFHIPSSVTELGDAVFEGCTGLTSITIPNSVTKIGRNAFCGCSSLRYAVLPNSITAIELGTFNGCHGLTSMYIPDSVTDMQFRSFGYCTSLMSIKMPPSLSRIGMEAFYCCSSLKSIDLPETLSYIGRDAFYECTSLTSLTVPADTIGAYAFPKCTSLSSLIISPSVNKIGNGAFDGCTQLKSVMLEDSPNPCEYMYPPLFMGRPEEPYAWPFETCAIEYLYIGREISSNLFDSIASIKAMSIGNMVTSIGNWFGDIYNLGYLEISPSVVEIKPGAFLRCTDLATINVHRADPPELFKYSFSSLTYQRATLHIPKGSKQAYSEAPFWKDFLNVADDLEPAGIDGVTADTDDGSFDVYNLQGQLLLRSAGADALPSLAPGIYIKAAGSRTEKIIIR